MEYIPIFPLHAILFPHTDFGIHVFEERYRALVTRCLESGEGFGVVLIRRGADVGGPAEPHEVGTLANISAHARLPDGRYLLEVEGARRFRIESLNGSIPWPQAKVSWLSEPIGDFGQARSVGDRVEHLLTQYLERAGRDPIDEMPNSPVARSYCVASALGIDLPEKQELLEMESAAARLAREASILKRELALIAAGILPPTATR